MAGGTRDPFCRESAAVPNSPPRRQRQVIVEQVKQAAVEAASDVGGGDVVATLLYALSHASNGVRGA